jgi:integrase/recombinase XerD
VRDAAMLALAFATGMRRAEIAHLQRDDLAEIPQGYEFTVRQGKGQKSRTVALFSGARDYMRDWLEMRGESPGPLFWAILKSGRVLQRGIGTRAMQKILEKRADQAGVTDLTGWHDARRTLAGALLDNGVDLATVQKILGHNSPVTTAAYDRRPEEARRKALQALHIPYLRRRML